MGVDSADVPFKLEKVYVKSVLVHTGVTQVCFKD